MSLAESGNTRQGGGSERLVIVLVVIAALGILFYLSSSRQQALRTSPSGMDGLAAWLNAEGIETRPFTGGWTIDADTVGINVVPVYDTVPGFKRVRPQTKEELLLQKDENDLGANSLNRRAALAPTLIVLPKWRSGLRLTGIAHPFLLLEPKDGQRVLAGVTGTKTGRVMQIPQPFTRFDYQRSDGENLEAELYIAQVFEGKGCDPIIGRAGEMVLAECPLKGADPTGRVFILSDPDLLNNHGLRLGDNALIAKDFLSRHVGDHYVLIDYSPSNFLRREVVRETRKRTWSDMLRFFAYPFSILWLGGGLAMLLVLWRAGWRFGPIPKSVTNVHTSKEHAMQAQAKLLRLTNQDGALLREYVPARLAAVANGLFGAAHAHLGGDEAAIMRHLKRHKPELATRFRDMLEAIRALPDALNAREAIGYVDEFELILEQITHDT